MKLFLNIFFATLLTASVPAFAEDDNSGSRACVLNNQARGAWDRFYEVFLGLIAEQRKACCLSAAVEECCNVAEASGLLLNAAAYNNGDSTSCQRWARNCKNDVKARELTAVFDNANSRPSHCEGQ